MFERWREKRRLKREPFPDEWVQYVSRSLSQWKYLDNDEREQLLDDARTLVADKNWEAAYGFALTDEIRVTIAAQASLLVLGIDDLDPFRNISTVIVHPTTMVFDGAHATHTAGVMSESPQYLLGLAEFDGPVIIAWDEVRSNARHPGHGHNVVFHEFAHKLDMLDGLINGTPPMRDPGQAARWVEVCTAEYDALRAGEVSILDSYGAEDVGEFFAVATEVFFDASLDLEAEKPDLYEVMRDFYRQDPAGRVRRGETRLRVEN